MTRLHAEVGGVNLAQGLPGLRPAAGSCSRRSPRRDPPLGEPPVRIHLGTSRRFARRSRRRPRASTRIASDPETRGHRDLRRVRGRRGGRPRVDRARRRGRRSSSRGTRTTSRPARWRESRPGSSRLTQARLSGWTRARSPGRITRNARASSSSTLRQTPRAACSRAKSSRRSRGSASGTASSP